jgi:hypothetical protein
MASFPSLFDRTKEFELFDDFVHLHDWWLAVNDGASGTNTLDDAHGGQYTVKTAGADNDYHFLTSDAESWKFQSGKPLQFEARFKLVEGATNVQNFVFGLSDDASATLLGADGAGPTASYDGALFFKTDGSLALQFESSNAGTQATNTSMLTMVSGQWYRIGFTFDPNDGTTGVLRPWAYDETAGVLYNNGGKSSDDWAQNITLSGLEEMRLVFGVKAGSATAEVLTVDYIGVRATR